ncbi:hypothetical protein [Staphylococcus simulans]|uniref:hypothetical protein n=1 Tax=Staphylococcus simulans TaxID=1286 RepID=UPI00131F414C|nr:hypothetical protein [Staphylococcus simulans]UXR29385.1 hypothetical protein MUA73_08170 [Staphylococcus simulans]
MSKLKAIKIALLIVILAEEIRNAKETKVFRVKINADTSDLKNYIADYKKSLK